MKKLILALFLFIFSISYIYSQDENLAYVKGYGFSNSKNISIRKNKAYMNAIEDLILNLNEIQNNKLIKFDNINNYIDIKEVIEEPNNYYIMLGLSKSNYKLYFIDKYNEFKAKLVEEKLQVYNKILEDKKIYDSYNIRINNIDEKLEEIQKL